MATMLQKLDKFHKTRLGYAVFGLVEFVLAVVFLDWALAEGEWLDWLITAVLALGIVQNTARFVMTFARKK